MTCKFNIPMDEVVHECAKLKDSLLRSNILAVLSEIERTHTYEIAIESVRCIIDKWKQESEVSPQLQQVPCSTLRVLLVQELNRLTTARDGLISVSDIDETDCEIERVKIAMEVIDNLQPVE